MLCFSNYLKALSYSSTLYDSYIIFAWSLSFSLAPTTSSYYHLDHLDSTS